MGHPRPAGPADRAALRGCAPLLLTELFVDEDCEAKFIMEVKASFQESSSHEGVLSLFMDQNPRVILFMSETTFQGHVTLLH